MPGIRIYPFKEVESGTVVDRNVIWESRASSALGGTAISGLVNVDLTPEVALRLGMALGTALRRGSRVVTSRAQQPACRLVRRALIAGISSTGVHVEDLRVMPAAVNRHLLKSEGFDAGIHVRPSEADPEAVQVQIFEPPGIQATPALPEGGREAFHPPGVPPRVLGRPRRYLLPRPGRGNVRRRPARDARRGGDPARGFRIVVDYTHSPASLVLPLVLGPLEVEAVASRAHLARAAPGRPRRRSPSRSDSQTARHGGRRRLRRGHRPRRRADVPRRRAGPGGTGRAGAAPLPVAPRAERPRGSLAFPITVTSLVEQLVAGHGLEVAGRPPRSRRSPSPPPGRAPSSPGRSAAASSSPSFLPAYDAVASVASSSSCSRPSDDRSPSSSTSCRSRPSCTAGAVPVGAQGDRHADPDRADEGDGGRPPRRDQDLRASAAGRRSSPTRTSRSCTSTPRVTPPRRPSARGRVPGNSSRRSWPARRTRAGSRR